MGIMVVGLDWAHALAMADRKLLLAANLGSGQGLLHRAITGIGNNVMLRSLPVFYFLIRAWLDRRDSFSRAQLLLGIMGAYVATAVSVLLQFRFHWHLRPMLDPSLPIWVPEPWMRQNWDRPFSFPSDTGTLYFALAWVVAARSRRAGAVCFAWLAITVGLSRVVMGFHYPSDLIGALIMSGLFVLVALRSTRAVAGMARVLDYGAARWPASAEWLFFVLLAEAYAALPTMNNLLHGARIILSALH